MNLSLEGKNAVICGSSQGIGLAIAQELTLLGASCILLARNKEKLEQAVASLSTSAKQSRTHYVIDVSDQVALQEILSDIVAKQRVHILINNSGGPAAGPIVNATPKQFLQAFNQHLVTNHLLTTTLVEGMKAEGYGRIINIISTSVKVPLPNLGVSNTIRGSVASWAKTMSNELAQFGITVNNILPGMTRTQRLDSIVNNAAQKSGKTVAEVEKEMEKEIPAKRFGEASEIAAVAAFLATPAAAYVYGDSIRVDGGRTGSI
jgi:3-oxoacyl-[acyl-carrier protein] reductase